MVIAFVTSPLCHCLTMKEKYLLRVNGFLFRVISTAASEEYLNFFWMGGVLRGDDKAVSKMDIKIQDTGRTRVIVLGHMTQWLSYQYPLRQNGLGKWLSHYATSNGGQVVRMLVRVISIVMVKITFSWLLVEASGFLAKNHGWESILLVTNPCFGTPGKDFTYIVRNWYILTNRVQQASFDSTEGLHT